MSDGTPVGRSSRWQGAPVAGVDWATLRHAYGSAADLPPLFDRLGGDDPVAAGRALGEIALRICHQGAAVEEATAPATLVLAWIAPAAEHSLGARIVGVLETVATSVGTWARTARNASAERRPSYAEKEGWERATVRSLRTCAEHFRARAGAGTGVTGDGIAALDGALARAEQLTG